MEDLTPVPRDHLRVCREILEADLTRATSVIAKSRDGHLRFGVVEVFGWDSRHFGEDDCEVGHLEVSE